MHRPRRWKGTQVSQSLLKLFRSSGDANVGQTLLRLARLAETAHQFHAAHAAIEETAAGKATSQHRVEGLDPIPVVNPPGVERHAGASLGKEAAR